MSTPPSTQASLEALTEALSGKDAAQGLAWVQQHLGGRATFSTSLGLEDQVLIHLLAQHAPAVRIFTLDTGRLFEETYRTLAATREQLGVNIQVMYPDTSAVQELVSSQGPYSFYTSLEARKQCCYIRKVEPLKRALQGAELWITGIRAEQNAHRNDLPQVEWDEGNQLLKYHPLLHWTEADVRAHLKAHNVPYNVLHDRGFPSIGCAPCTRAIKPGEDPRAGRWWWERGSTQECGLHETPAHEPKP